MLKKILIASGAVWLIVAIYVLYVRGEVASVLPFGMTVALLIVASVQQEEKRDPLVSSMSFDALKGYIPEWKDLAILVILVTGAILYAASLSYFMCFLAAVGFVCLIAYSHPTPEIKKEAAVCLGPERS